MPNLLHAHAALPFRHVDPAQRFAKHRARKADQRRLCRRHIALERPLLDGRTHRGGIAVSTSKRRRHGRSDEYASTFAQIIPPDARGESPLRALCGEGICPKRPAGKGCRALRDAAA
jgi:hypothetical protein